MKKKLSPKHPLKCFMQRIGKTIYGRDTGEYGFKIRDKFHAKVIEMYQNDLDLYYADEPFNF